MFKFDNIWTKKKAKRVATIGICVFLGIVLFYFVLFPYIKAEYYTAKYGEQFKDLYSLTRMIDDVEFYRIIEYTETNAKVYYVEKDSETTNYVYFFRDTENDEWELETWETIYSKRGSASDAAWPYYFKDFIR